MTRHFSTIQKKKTRDRSLVRCIIGVINRLFKGWGGQCSFINPVDTVLKGREELNILTKCAKIKGNKKEMRKEGNGSRGKQVF